MGLNLVVVTPQGEAFAEDVEAVVLPGSEGDFGVLASHERFLAPLRPGPVEIRLESGQTEWAGVSGGFAEVSGDQVVVLVDECFKAHEVDRDAVMLSQEEAQAALDAMASEEHESDNRALHEEAVVRASVQLEIHAKHHS